MKRIEELIRLRAEGKGGYPAWQDCPLTKCPVMVKVATGAANSKGYMQLRLFG